jgi:hypothetical protein
MGPVPATGKTVGGWHMIDILQPSADSKIMHDWGYTNTNELLAQIGQLKAPGGDAAKPAPKAPEPKPKTP